MTADDDLLHGLALLLRGVLKVGAAVRQALTVTPPPTPRTVNVTGGLSPLETRIIEAIAAAGGPLQGKEVAHAIGAAYDSTLKVLLRNLVDRGILYPIRGEGYDLTEPRTSNPTA